MRRILIIAVLLLGVGSTAVFADDAATNTVVQGNQGYVYGTPPKADETTTATATPTSNDPGPIADIINAVWKLDAWVRRNLW